MTLTLPAEVPMSQQPRTKRPLGVTRARQQAQQVAQPRAAARAARDYAEQWHQALKAWKTRVPQVVLPLLRYGPGGSFDLSTLGEHLPDLPSSLVTPMGEVRETEVADIIKTMLDSGIPDTSATGGFLERYRRGHTTPASLTDPRGGWEFPKPRSVAYAVACLSLATRLGDKHPDLPRHLATCRAALRAEDVAEIPR
ncbi:hypothetical protein GO986_08655 [Deinococcus sp. HMF7620]|uniref:Uncharacterized protein n=1 Tax=Deinococcus arboris TaxID=2682977 RepID=A0A7C9HRA3_9DEIO|nr:hypothetical protein [Deinococcus arboris]MVN86832.1 hypothetical protein [Deinococcus arboris]